jgi:predicted extracellular nuclease
MLVTFPQDLFITEFFNYDRFGEMVLATSRQYQGTHLTDPGAPANAVAAANALARITLDDGLNSQNPPSLRHPDGEVFALDHTFRGGDILQGVEGVLGYAFGRYRVHPTVGATYIAANPRPTAPDPIPGDLRVASFNVLNFFTNLDTTSGSGPCGPTGTLECRGANTAEEYERQLAKLVAGIVALDADVVGIQEIENDIRTEDGNRAHDAVLTLVEQLNAMEGAGTWAWAGAVDHYNNYPVRNEIIYRPAAVTPIGSPVALAHEAFDATRPGDIEPLGRPPLAQTFRSNAKGSGQPFTVVVNHFKSKGSSCEDIGDPDLGDGQANCNLTRVAQAEALLDFVALLEEDSSGVLVIGDLNSYAQEDPIRTLESGGLTDLVERYEGASAYSYVFDGQLGYLDTALATRSMSNWVQGLTVFHINADEPDVLDYDMSFKPPAQDALYEPLPYRVSDHDPVIVGISLGGPGGRR